MTTELLTRVLDAHGGIERWQQFTRIEASIPSELMVSIDLSDVRFS
jgi:hypothetical protein